MRKILYNLNIVNNSNVDLDFVYQFLSRFLEVKGEKDVVDVVSFCVDYYKKNLFFPSVNVIKENFKDFEFLEEKFESKDEFISYIKEKYVLVKKEVRKHLLNKLLSDDLDYNDRLNKLNDLMKLEYVDKVNDVYDISNVDLYNIYKTKNYGKAIFTNISDIDEITGGIIEGKILVVMAGAKCFKTTFLLNMCVKNAYDFEDNNSLFLSLEIPKLELNYKILLRYGYQKGIDLKNITFTKILKGSLDEEEEKILKDLSDGIKKDLRSKIIILSTEDIVIDTLLNFRMFLEDIINKFNIKTIYVDYLQLFKFFSKNSSNIYEYQNEVMAIFRYISVVYNVRFVIATQINKEGMKYVERTGGKYSLSDVAESNALLRDCYYLVSIYSDDILKKNNQLKVQLLYNRDGETFVEPKYTCVKPQFYYIGSIQEQINRDNIKQFIPDDIISSIL